MRALKPASLPDGLTGAGVTTQAHEGIETVSKSQTAVV